MSAADVLAVLNGQPPTPTDDGTCHGLREDATLWPEIRAIIETSITSAPRSRQREIGPSELGTDCLRCLAAKLAGWQQDKGAAWLPFIGTCVHERFERTFTGLNKQGFDPDMRNRRFETEKRVTVGSIHGLAGGYDVQGSIDLYDRHNAATADWKIVGATTMKTVKAHGPSQTYLCQASLYGIGLTREEERVEHMCIFFLPRNGLTLRDALPVQMRFDPKPGMWALTRAQLLVTFMDLIEQSDGADVRDAWIRTLPKSTGHCFDCGTWANDRDPVIPEPAKPRTEVPERWTRLTPLLEARYPQSENTEQHNS